jgi:MFS transporter, DHA1 family, tetracycline resistance protein
MRKASVPFIFATIFLDSLGIGIVLPILPDLIRRFASDPDFVSRYLGYFMSVYALMQFIASPVLGILSDRFGRRPILLSSLLGAGLDYLVMAFAPNLIVLFIGRLVSGLTGASFTVATAYMADISDDTNRSSNFGMIGAAFGLGFIVGPAIGGLMGQLGPTAPFMAAAALNLLNFVFGYFILPESLAPENRRSVDISKMNPFTSLKKVLAPSKISLLIWVYALLYLAGNSHPSIWALYSETKYGWTAAQVGISLAAVGVTTAIVQGGLVRIIIPKLGEPRALFLGTIVFALSFVAFALATQGWMVYVILIFASLDGIAMPALQSLVTAKVPADEQGELQGSLVSLGSVTAVVAPLFYTYVFAEFSKPTAPIHFLGMPYLMAALLSVGALFLAHRGLKVLGLTSSEASATTK